MTQILTHEIVTEDEIGAQLNDVYKGNYKSLCDVSQLVSFSLNYIPLAKSLKLLYGNLIVCATCA